MHHYIRFWGVEKPGKPCQTKIIPDKMHLELIREAIGDIPEYLARGDKKKTQCMRREMLALLQRHYQEQLAHSPGEYRVFNPRQYLADKLDLDYVEEYETDSD